MNAAIYARISHEDKAASDDKKVQRQVDYAQAFAKRRGWTVHPAHVYIDDGISGAEFAKRGALQRMLSTLKPRPAFSVLVVSELKSIGREMVETQFIVKQLAQAGVEIFEYVHGKSLTPKQPVDKLLSSVEGYAAEDHARKTSERNHEGAESKFQRGHHPGGRVFGYRNVHQYSGVDADGNPKRTHTLLEINPIESAVVLRMFELFASGIGVKRICRQLNAEVAPHPKPFNRKDTRVVKPVPGWAPSTVRSILNNSIYHGVVTWNKSKKRDEWLQKNQRRRPLDEWLRKAMPHLKIIPDDLWAKVSERRADTAGRIVNAATGRNTGRSLNLLSGLASCGWCGGSLVVETSARKNGRVAEYVCFRHRYGSCANKLRIETSTMNEQILQQVEEHCLSPEAVESFVRLTERDDLREQRRMLEREAKDIEKRIKTLVQAIEAGGDAASLVARLKVLEDRRAAIAELVTTLVPLPRLPETVVSDHLTEWRRLLRGSVTQGRSVLQRIVKGRITFTPTQSPFGKEIDSYVFEAPTRYDKLFAGVATPRPSFVTVGGRAGREAIGPNEGFEDYGRLLERAALRLTSERGSSPTGFEPVFWR